MKRILHLTLKKEWFDKIAEGKKKTEYRKVNQYWFTRLSDKVFDEIWFRNGYTRDRPFMKVECKSIKQIMITEGCSYGGCILRYAIKLGKVLEIRNYKKR